MDAEDFKAENDAPAPPPRRPQRTAPKPPKKITADHLHNAGLYYLQRFAASSQQFRRVMMRRIDKSCRHHTEQNREQCVSLLEDLIEKFTRAGLLDDEAFTRGSIMSLRRRGYSRRAIQARLTTKGLEPALIARMLAHVDEDNAPPDNSADHNAEAQAALHFLQRKRLGPYAQSRPQTRPQSRPQNASKGPSKRKIMPPAAVAEAGDKNAADAQDEAHRTREKALAALARAGFGYDLAQRALARAYEECELENE